MAYGELRRALLSKLQITPQGLNLQCQKLKAVTPLTTEEATYIIAYRNGIRLDGFVDRETVARVRDLCLRMTKVVTSVSQKDVKVENKTVRQRTIKIGDDKEYVDAILPRKKLQEALEMAKVFPQLYVLENSIREFIGLCMTNLYGENWWDTQAPPKLRDGVRKKMARDKKDSWHQRRGSHPVDYLDMSELPSLVNKMQQFIVPGIIPSIEWFKQLTEEVYKSRCVVCHMNPLEKNSIKSVEVKFHQWQKQMNDKKEAISRLTSQTS